MEVTSVGTRNWLILKTYREGNQPTFTCCTEAHGKGQESSRLVSARL